MKEIGLHGGARPGSGRKPGKERKVTVSFRVTESTRDRIREMREAGHDVTRELEAMIERECQ